MRISLKIVAAFLLLAAASRDAVVADEVLDLEIRIGNVMPYTGELAAFGTIGRAEAAYFDMINAQGGINGRKVKFISYDDGADPVATREQTQKLVETDHVLLMFGSLGTPQNLAVRPYLNERKIPQLFIASGDEEWSHPKSFPWTLGFPPTYRSEGRIYANYIQASYPERRIAVLWQNDQFGRDLFRGLQEGLGDWARMIVTDVAVEGTEKSLDAQVDVLQSSGAEVVLLDAAPPMAAKALRRMNDIGWHPVLLLDNASASIAQTLRPAGLENSIGVISTAFLKDASDPAWKDDPAMQAWSAFMDKYYPDGDKADSNAVYGYASAETLTQVLRQCGDDLSRENILRQATSLRNYHPSMLLPSIAVSTGPSDYRPIKQMRLVQFDGYTWQPIGEVIESAFVGTTGQDRPN
ncbi:MAG TPA: ABC transporter substrate-binding protein [Bradyrhizobium sp.]|nr:ABC transporter substrate-binding protein [Bradyrhizobium sp.]